MRKLLLLLALLPSVAFADKIVYIRTDCANDGDGTTSSCAASAGAAGAHKTCQEAITDEVAANANLVTAGFGNLILDAAGATADGDCLIDGFTTDSTHLVRLYVDPANRHAGVWNTGKYRLTSNSQTLRVWDQYIEIDGVQAETTGTGTGNYCALCNFSNTGGLSLKTTNSVFRAVQCSTGGGGTCHTVHWRPDVANTRLTFANNIGYGPTTSFNNVFNLRGSGGSSGEITIAYNNTAYGGVTGFQFDGNGTGDALYWKNNIAVGAATACYALSGTFTTNTSATNLSSDTTSPNNTWDSLTPSFVSTTSGSEDLHLQSGDTAAKDQGTDLSGDAQYAFSTDIDGATRSGTWDIGADEVSGSSAAAQASRLNANLNSHLNGGLN